MEKWLKRKVHISWHVAWLSTGIIIGIALSTHSWATVFSTAAWCLVSAGLLITVVARRMAMLVLAALVAGFLIGLWRGGTFHGSLAGYQPLIGQRLVLQATVADDAAQMHNQLGLKLRAVQIGGHAFGGEIWAVVTSSSTVERDDRVTLTGNLESGFGNFAASLSHARLVARLNPPHRNLFWVIRNRFNEGIKRALPSPQAELATGYLTGQHNDLPPDLIKQLELIGLIHLVIAGGYNVTILVRSTRRLFIRFSKYLALLSSVLLLLSFALMTGFIAPMARTTIVTGLSLAAWYYGRKFHPLVLLPVAAAVTGLVSPAFVQGDVGWYMTFIAYGGLIILAPLIKHYFWGSQTAGVLKQLLVDTLAVQIVTMPLIADAFKQYSLFGLPANLLVLPLMPITMLSVVLAGIGGMLLPQAVAQLVGWPATQLTAYTLNITQWLANASGTESSASLTNVELGVVYTGIALVIFLLWRKTTFNLRSENIVE